MEPSLLLECAGEVLDLVGRYTEEVDGLQAIMVVVVVV